MVKFSVAAGSEDEFAREGGAGRTAAPFEAKMVAALDRSYSGRKEGEAYGPAVKFTVADAAAVVELRREILRWGKHNGRATAMRPAKPAGENFVHVKVGDVRKREPKPTETATATEPKPTETAPEPTETVAPAQSPAEQPAT